MVKGKSKKTKVVGKRDESDATQSADITIVGVLFDKATFVLASVEDPSTPIGEVVPALGLKLQTHVNTTFGTQLTLSPSATIAGITNSPLTEPVADVLKRLPPETMLTVLFVPISKDQPHLTNQVKEMAVDKQVQRITTPDSPQSPRDLKILDKLMQMVEGLQKKIEIQDVKIAALTCKNAELEATNAAVMSENARLRARVTDLENETRQLREASIGDLEALRALRRRILLDEARRLILAAWAPSKSDLRWHQFRAEYTSRAQVQTFIQSKQVFLRPLTTKALDQVLDTYADMRMDGNNVAHKADENLIRDAVEHATSPDNVQVLTVIWESVYNKNFQEG